MVVVLSRFRVANSMEADVARAFRERPREVESTPGFLWLEVLVDRSDAAVFYLVTRWTDLESYERWHSSPAHRDSHALIPKGLKLDPSWTQVVALERLDGTLGPPLTEAIADAPLLIGRYASGSASTFVFVLGADATIRSCNPAGCQELAEGALLDGRSLLEFMPEADAHHLQDLLAKHGRHRALLNFAAANRAPFSLDCWIDVQPAGATLIGHPLYRREQQFHDELMAINQELAVLSRERTREVRDERSGREAAEKLNRERNTFLAVLAHELRQPIGSALAAMAVLRRVNPDPNLERPRALLERQLKQITRLVEDLSDTARIAAGEVELRRSEIDVTRQLRELATAWEALAHDEHKTFGADLPDTPLIVSGDIDRLQQIFSNLMSNAFKYTPPGGHVQVRLRRDGDAAVIEVRDEGEGIPLERLPRIFELFQRATTTGSGLGVGLAVVKALVDAHGGTIAVTSAGLGEGATFTVRLPLYRG
jgi:signal transduction histidine kinase/heme-degrading monooxygenase HmoA